MGRLTGWVLDEALRQCADWRSSGHELTVAVNISATNLLSEGFTDWCATGWPATACRPDALVLEITETTVISDFDGSKAVIDELLALGVDVSIDDFGAGVTSLAHLSALAVRELKLDRLFISDLGRRRTGARAAAGPVDGRARARLGLRVVAEGIEDIATLQLVSQLGCDLAQGYFIGKPKPAAGTDFHGRLRAGPGRGRLNGQDGAAFYGLLMAPGPVLRRGRGEVPGARYRYAGAARPGPGTPGAPCRPAGRTG